MASFSKARGRTLRSRRDRSAQHNRNKFNPRFELLEPRNLLSANPLVDSTANVLVRSINGSGNNVANPAWGMVGTDFIRLAAAAYADGISSPALPQDQSARAISNIVNNQAIDPNNPSAGDIETVDQKSLSDYGYAFGQFMDHDMDLTPDGGASFPIAVAPGDPIGPNALPFTRSLTDPNTGTSTSNPAQQFNNDTSFLDLSQVYGSTQEVSDALRTMEGGLLKTSDGNMLPFNSTDFFTTDQIRALNMANDSHVVSDDKLYAAGDRRANENIELTAIQTLFMRNHNRIAAQLQMLHPDWTDEQLFQEARKINIADYQSIIYNEWIPAVLGTRALPGYSGYKSNVNPTISNEFATVGFRFGHSLLSAEIGRDQNNGTPINDPQGGEVPLVDAFFNPTLVNPAGVVDPVTGHLSTDIGPILKAMADGDSQAMDVAAVNDVRNLLFGNGQGGQDLIARDIQRDRDNGIPDYNTLRQSVGLKPVTSFADITKNIQVQQALQQAYGSVDNIDAFEGGLAEDHVPGSDVGPLFQAIMVDQFTRLRDGDRFFYLNENFSPSEQQLLRQGNTLAEVIQANSTASNLQNNVMQFKASISGIVSSFSPFRLNGVSGITVDLKNVEGEVVATTVTDSRGHYRFNQLSGVSATGNYTISLELANGQRDLPQSRTVAIDSGDTFVNNVNFLVVNSVRQDA